MARWFCVISQTMNAQTLRHWMIELWEGQYGLGTGCEIGVYSQRSGVGDASIRSSARSHEPGPGDPRAPRNLLYKCDGEGTSPGLSLTLKRETGP